MYVQSFTWQLKNIYELQRDKRVTKVRILRLTCCSVVNSAGKNESHRCTIVLWRHFSTTLTLPSGIQLTGQMQALMTTQNTLGDLSGHRECKTGPCGIVNPGLPVNNQLHEENEVSRNCCGDNAAAVGVWKCLFSLVFQVQNWFATQKFVLLLLRPTNDVRVRSHQSQMFYGHQESRWWWRRCDSICASFMFLRVHAFSFRCTAGQPCSEECFLEITNWYRA